MDGAQFAKMLSDKHLFELDRMEYKYSTVSVKEFAELLRQNFARPLPLTDFSGNKLFYLPNLAQISTNGMKQLLSVPVSGQNFGLSAMTEEIYATFQIESIRSTRSSIRYILDGYAPRDEQEARIYGMKRGLEFIANRQNTITEENLHYLYQISTGDYLPDEDRLLPNHFYRHGDVFIVGGEEPRPGLPAERLPGAMKCLVDFANANDGIRVVAAVICDSMQEKRKIYATARGYGDYKGQWEFPGGKIEPGETPQQALKREIEEELDTEITVEDLIGTIEYDYPAFHLSMDCFWCEVVSGDLVLKEAEAARWLTKDDIDSVPWLPADRTILDAVRSSMRQTMKIRTFSR